MKLQNILFPTASTAEDGGMYFFTSSKIQDSGQIRLEAGESLSTDTYFNGLSADKWKKYTVVRDVTLTLHLQGKVHYELFSKVDKAGRDEKLAEGMLTPSTCWETLPIPWEEARGIVYFRLTALEPAVFYGGWYACATPAQRPVKIALDICTFRREAYVKENCGLLWERMTRDPDFGHFLIFVVDNGRTLTPGDLPEGVRLFPNANTGGSGGFTRGLMEIQQAARQEGITHALLMDDDVLLEPEALLRTYALLSLVKEEYQDGVVGGAMLRMDKKSVLVESGALWNRGWLISGKMGLDVSLPGACLESEREEPVDYTAWWYTCVPLSLAREDNLPLPFFVRGDDVEYGLRNARHILLLNGICIWHEPFENKYAPYTDYYILRNQLIGNAIHNQTFSLQEIQSHVKNRVMEEVYMYRYGNARLLMDAVEDFLKGVDWLKQTDAQALHQEILKKGGKFLSPEETAPLFDRKSYEKSIAAKAELPFFHKVVRRLTVNGTFLPSAVPMVSVPVQGNLEINVYRAEKALYYDKATGRGFVARKDPKQAKDCLKRLHRLERQLSAEYEKTNNQFRQRYRELTNRTFWRAYLGLPPET